jgi:uncharacterized protein YbjQ (UPF0145 family)
MIVATTDYIPGKRVTKVLGLVRGNTVRARHIGKDILAGLKNIIGGEIEEYTKMLAEAREQSLDRMMEEAMLLDADAVIMVRFMTASIMERSSELLAYGTAVNLADE